VIALAGGVAAWFFKQSQLGAEFTTWRNTRTADLEGLSPEATQSDLHLGDYVRVRSPADGAIYEACIEDILVDEVTVAYTGEWEGAIEQVSRADVVEILSRPSSASDNRRGPWGHRGHAENFTSMNPGPADREWFDVLGVSQNASVYEIRTAWRTQIKQYHPDHVANLGAELKALAERKTQELNWAYEQGMALRTPAVP
jgi:DnaJ like chaperone protein